MSAYGQDALTSLPNGKNMQKDMKRKRVKLPLEVCVSLFADEGVHPQNGWQRRAKTSDFHHITFL
jgi:hypothetical protein